MKQSPVRNIASAGSDTEPSDYYYRFKQFCSFYPLRERHLADSILGAIDKLTKRNSTSFSILDIGSADGSLLGEIISLLRAALGVEIHCVAVEPDQVAFSRLEVTAELLRESRGVFVHCINSRIEEMIAGRQLNQLGKFNFILCSHVFYHLKDWTEIITEFKFLLDSGGYIIVTLDSFNSPIYQFRRPLETIIGNHGAIQEYGAVTSAEDFFSFLKKTGFSFFTEISIGN